MDKERVLGRLEESMDDLNEMLNKIKEGDITFSEAGDWLHDMGDRIVSAIDDAILYVKGSGLNE